MRTMTLSTRSYSMKPLLPSTTVEKRRSSASWRMTVATFSCCPSIDALKVDASKWAPSARVALALLVAVLGADAALDRVHAALRRMQLVRLGPGLVRLEAGLRRLCMAAFQRLPGRRLAVVLLLGLEQCAGIGQRLLGRDRRLADTWRGTAAAGRLARRGRCPAGGRLRRSLADGLFRRGLAGGLLRRGRLAGHLLRRAPARRLPRCDLLRGRPLRCGLLRGRLAGRCLPGGGFAGGLLGRLTRCGLADGLLRGGLADGLLGRPFCCLLRGLLPRLPCCRARCLLRCLAARRLADPRRHALPPVDACCRRYHGKHSVRVSAPHQNCGCNRRSRKKPATRGSIISVNSTP